MKLKLFSLITIIGISLIWGCKDTDTPDLITHDTTPYELDYGYFPTPPNSRGQSTNAADRTIR